MKFHRKKRRGRWGFVVVRLGWCSWWSEGKQQVDFWVDENKEIDRVGGSWWLFGEKERGEWRCLGWWRLQKGEIYPYFI